VLVVSAYALGTAGAWQVEESKNMSNNSERLLVNVDFVRLIQRHLPTIKLVDRTVTEAGLLYDFAGSKPDERLSAVIAVYADATLASAAVEYQITRTSVGPSHRDKSGHHDLALWKTEDPMSGSLLLRRENVVVRFLNGIPFSVRLNLIEQIDQALQSVGPDVTLATEVHPPEIVNVKLPDHISRASRVEASIEVANVLPADALFGADNPHVLISTGPKPTLAYYAPSEPTHENIVLIISTPGNLISKKTIPVDVK